MGVTNMTFEHDGETITIDIGERTTGSFVAVAQLASPRRAFGANAASPWAAVQNLLRRLSAVLEDAGRPPLSRDEEAALLARVSPDLPPPECA